MGELVVGVDGSEGSRRALAWAVTEARLRGDDVAAVFVLQPPAIYLDRSGLGQQYRAQVEPAVTERAEAMLDEMVAEHADAGITITPEAIHDVSPYQVLIDRAAGTSGLVVGTRGHSGYRRLQFGSVSQQVVVHAQSPVVVVPVREDAHGRRERVLAGVDGSEGAHRAVRRAAEEARLRACELELIAVQPPPPVAASHPPSDAAIEAWMWSGATPPDFDMTGDVQRQREQVVGHWRHVAESELDDEQSLIDPDERPEKISTTVIGDKHVARALLDAAEWASLLVVGSRGRGGFAGMLLGSVSQHCVRQATSPVMVIPPDVE